MYVFAYVCLLIALLVSLCAGSLALLFIFDDRYERTRILKISQWGVAAFLLLASAILLHALFWRDYRLEYVASYVDNVLPAFYRITAFWAGQPGSMLFWALVQALAGAIFAFAVDKLDKRVALWFWVYNFALTAFFCLVLTCWSNPFVILNPAPTDGAGLNPLLQNPGMIFHPPLLFLGYALFAVPGCVALAKLTAPAGVPAGITRAYVVWGWVTLTAGIVLGAWWAYMELGWGGYWAWDPVENASLIPWLMACAAMHVLAINKTEGKLGRTADTLMALVVISAVFGTYLTRSGVIQSVHAFGDGGVGAPLLLFVGSSLLLTFAAALTAPRVGEKLAYPLGREGLTLLATWLFIALALIILVATVWPVLTQIAGAAPRGLDASFYNRVCLPLCAILLVILAFCGWIGWRGDVSPAALKRLIAIGGAFVVSACCVWVAGYHKLLPLLTAAASVAVLCSMAARCLDKAIWHSSRAFRAAGAHFGVALLALGVSFSGPYVTEKDLILAKGEKAAVGPYEVTLEKITDGAGAGYDFLRANLKISLNGKTVGTLAPERRMYAKFGDMQFSEVDVISTLGQDIYSSLSGMDDEYKIYVKISLEPLVNWIWLGGLLTCLLPLLGLFLGRERQSPA